MQLPVGGPACAWNIFLTCEVWKKLELLEMHLCLWPDAHILFRHKRRNWSTASLLFCCFDEYSCVVYMLEFFSSVRHFSSWFFLVLPCHGNVCNWIPKLIWPRPGFIWIFCWNMPRFLDFISAWTQIFQLCSNVFLIWWHQILDIYFDGYCGLFFKCACNF